LQLENRYVFFLMRDRGVIRAVRDYWRTNILVHSGRHKALPFTSDVSLQERIAVLLFSPGDDLNASWFSHGLSDASGFAYWPLGPWQTANALKALLSNPNPTIRVGACEELTLDFVGQDGCWNTLDIGDGNHLRYHAGGMPPMVMRLAYRHQRMMTQDPQKWWTWAQRFFPKTDVLDELKLLTTDKDERTRRKFCGLLREKYPLENDSGCGFRQR
jgi:hypothetical protein